MCKAAYVLQLCFWQEHGQINLSQRSISCSVLRIIVNLFFKVCVIKLCHLRAGSDAHIRLEHYSGDYLCWVAITSVFVFAVPQLHSRVPRLVCNKILNILNITISNYNYNIESKSEWEAKLSKYFSLNLLLMSCTATAWLL